MGRIERQRELARNRARRAKLKKLRLNFEKATNQSDKNLIIAKVRRVSPLVDLEASTSSN